jgi:hypothetical protein
MKAPIILGESQQDTFKKTMIEGIVCRLEGLKAKPRPDES